jgi:hypothetical protein
MASAGKLFCFSQWWSGEWSQPAHFALALGGRPAARPTIILTTFPAKSDANLGDRAP